MKNICVYCSSSKNIDEKYFIAAKELGEKMAKCGFGLVYGGSSLGLMGEVALTAQKAGAKVLGVVPQKIFNTDIDFPKEIELVITDDMRERKKTMELRADAFIAMPGGFGTLEEVSEIIVSKQLGYHFKPIVILNVDGYYDKLFELFDNFYNEKFAHGNCKEIFYKANCVDDALNYIMNYKPVEDKDKWLEKFSFTK
ncbi:MAG: TIGR00730 family Rossman fold protein [bacterium]|nr:TIGR00730 family Rossman fold protein [bacterium]